MCVVLKDTSVVSSVRRELKVCQPPEAGMTGFLDGLSVSVPGGGQMDRARASRHCVKTMRATRTSCGTRWLCVAVMAVGLVAVATAQTPDTQIVFRDPTVSPSSLLKRATIDLVARGYVECPRHTCQKEGRQPRKKEDWEDTGCFCDDACGMYGDCCRDAPKATEKPRGDLKCMPLKQYGGVYVVFECPAEWPRDDARKMCESPSNDLRAEVLVTNRRSGITYRNLGCAVCHADSEEVVPWQTRLECPKSLKGPQAKRLNQSETGEWGVIQTENGTETFHACVLDPYMPETVTDVIRTCQPFVDTCPDSWTNKRVADLCGAYTARVYDRAVGSEDGNPASFTFRNPHCALCNGLDVLDTVCTSEIGFRFGGHNEFHQQAFSILLDFSEETGSNIVGAKTVCDEGELFDEASIKCRTVVCDDGFELQGDECVAFESRVVFSDGGVDAEVADFQRCPKFYLAKDEFVKRDDGTVIVEQYQRTFGPGEFEIRGDELAICAVNSNFRKFSDTLTIMSLIFLACSIFCLCCHLVLFCLVPDLRNLSGKNLVSLCVCLLVGYICFMASPFETANTDECRAVGIIMYTAFIASFFWMNVMAFDVYISLRQASTELRVSSGNQRKRYLLYLLYVCAMTSALVAAAVATDNSADEDNPFRPAFGKRVCWFSKRRSLMVFFAAPLIAIMVANVAFFFGSTRIIGMTRQATASMSCGPTKTNLRLYSRLAVITGLSWLTGLIAGWLDFPPLWYAFVILNTLQGVFIFVFFTLADRVRDRIRRDLSRYSRWQAGGNLQDDVPDSDIALPCTDSTALQLTDSKPCA